MTRIAFGFKSPDALIALAMLSLGGHKPVLPGRIEPTEGSGEPDFCTAKCQSTSRVKKTRKNPSSVRRPVSLNPRRE